MSFKSVFKRIGMWFYTSSEQSESVKVSLRRKSVQHGLFVVKRCITFTRNAQAVNAVENR